MDTNLLRAKSQKLKAILDLGTNTFHLLIAEVQESEIKEHYQKQIPVKIGAGGINSGVIAPDAYLRGMEALAQFHEIISQYSIASIVATGTSAIRNAKNGAAFLAEARDRFGFIIESISGDLEAELIYKGVGLSFNFPEKAVLVMDIGGGSVEFIIGKKDKILWKQSFEIGAARLLERFRPSNPILESEIAEIRQYLQEMLKPLTKALVQTEQKGEKVDLLIGSAGSFETLLDVLKLDLHKTYTSITPFAHKVSRENVNLFFGLILHSTEAERKELKGLLDFRVDMIVVATLLFKHVLDTYSIGNLVASNYALKEGLLKK
jgi:exopolyphosphatase/guanosine-5'-triphosphate,3'-diphosphate pyrophosphatase